MPSLNIFELTTAWKSAFPNAHVGVLVMGAVANPAQNPELERHKAELEEQLRAQFSGRDRAGLSNHPILQVYNNYYRRFKKTYHVQLQLESVAWKGKSIPSVSPLVEAMFMAEVKNLLLTAGHDLDTLHLPLVLDISKGDERYTLMRGEEQILKEGDMFIRDQSGVISSIIYGPDRRTQITAKTHNVVFTGYAPSGIDKQAVEQHLQDIRKYIMMIEPEAKLELLQVYS